jgi:quinol-cytochrome oxidoreductase complex cytochrome b subunit/mono/diheme cytochrome c family protein
MIRRIIRWLDSRTGLETAIKNFLYEDVPASSGWHQVFGSVALFSFLVQVFTGILLAFNYAPTPGEAYNSLQYIITEVTGGRLIRGLHHWGASMMLIIVVLHMIQVFVYGSYKKPRETTWMAGVVLLLITLGFGLTGYLLPWDNRAYWGTVVTTKIAAQAPVAGPYIARLLGGESSIGVVTFARFYALHVLLLPPLTMLLIAAHIYLVRKHGVAPAPCETAPKKKFFPEQAFKDTVAIFIGFVVLFVLSIVARVPLGQLADATDTNFIPRPEWYFLFLFQTLKYFEGPLEVVGSVVLPSLAILALFLVPFIDRAPAMKLGKRGLAIGAVVLAVLAWTGLTAAAIATTPKSVETAAFINTVPLSWQQLSPEELAAIGYFREEKCASCHPAGKRGIGPLLAQKPIHRSATWMIAHFKHQAQMMSRTAIPVIQLTDRQSDALAAFLLKLNPRYKQALQSAPDTAVQGALVYHENHCNGCHMVNGVGMKVGPPLNGLATRRDKSWVKRHFLEPAKVSPGSIMPAYSFNLRDMEYITGYLLQLPKTIR